MTTEGSNCAVGDSATGDNWVLADLKKNLEKAKDQQKSGTKTFTRWCPYMVGGNGYVYNQEEIDIMKELVTLGIEIDTGIVSKYSDISLHIAYCHDNQPMIDFLISRGADQTAKRYDGRTPQQMGSLN